MLLVGLEFCGTNTPHGNKGFDINNATINNVSNCKIEVKSKVYKNASVIHCNDNKFIDNGMTHLAVVIVKEDYYVDEAWILEKEDAYKLRESNTKTKYINLKKLRAYQRKIDITTQLNNKAKEQIKKLTK